MQSYLDQRKVKRNAALGKVLGFGGLGVMGIGLLISFRQPYDINLVFALFLVGMISSQIGMPMVNRWGRSPRIDEVLDGGLRGLDSRFAIFHYLLGTDHALVTPGGIFAVIPRLEDGRIEFADGRWTQTRQARGLLRRGGTRAIRGLERTIEAEPPRLQRRLSRHLNGDSPPEVNPLVVFLHHGAQVDDSSAPVPATHLKKLKGTLRKLPRSRSLEEPQIQQLIDRFRLG